jgi:predicted ATPase/DNA-binding SARP family transcriptional activator
LRIGILGLLDVRDAAGRAIEVRGSRLRTLLIRLAIDAGRTVTTGRLVGDVWEDDPPAAAPNALQALVSRLRGAGGPAMIESRPGGYRLLADPGDVDAVAFERLVSAGRTAIADTDPERGAATLREALSLWRGPALADVADAGFAAAPIARLEELRAAATEDRVEAELALGQAAGLVPELEEFVTAHPLRERARGQLMRALCASGRQAEALTVYEETRRILATSLGVDPSPWLSDLHLAVLRRDPELEDQQGHLPGVSTAAASPPERQRAAPARRATPAPASRNTNLPAQLTSFVGREEEIKRVGKLLGESRLVTLTGTGGAGKTRLAAEAAGGFVGEIPDGVWFVPLAPVRDQVGVPQAALAAIGVPEIARVADAVEAQAGFTQPLDRLADVLASKRLILVLDNCEHLIDAVARLADRVLAQAPEVRILATSREPIGITGETLCPVPSLPLPPENIPAGEAMGYAAIRLFADRAAAVRPGFAVDEQTAGPVTRICRALDGIPLAIELAAARVRALTPGQVADRLDDRFRLLNVGSRTALPRHQTLRAIVDWSWDLLDAGERRVLRRLSVFRGGATPESAERVCAFGGDRSEVIDVIASLVDKSLVTATGNGEVRYGLLETVLAYAGERLAEAGEEDRARDAHAAYFLEFAETAEPELRTHRQLPALQRLTAEHDNCLAALRHAIATRDAPLALRLVRALAWFWLMRDFEAEAGKWAAAVLGIAGDTPPPGLEDAYAGCEFAAAIATASTGEAHVDAETVVGALRRAASLVTEATAHPVLAVAIPLVAVFSGDREGARRNLQAIAHHQDPWVRAASRAFSGFLAINIGELDDAVTELTEGYAAFRAIGDRWGMIGALAGLAEAAMARGEPAEAIRCLEEARGYASEGVAVGQGEMLLIPLGKARTVLGDTGKGRADIERGVESAARIGEHDDEASGYVEISELDRRAGDLESARRLLERALEIVERKPSRPDMGAVSAKTYSKLGCLAEQQGDLTAAAKWHAKAMGVITSVAFLPANPSHACVVEGFAALAAARGDPVRAAELLGTAHTLHGFRDTTSFDVTRVTAAAAGAIGRDAFDAAYERGRKLTRDQALALEP